MELGEAELEEVSKVVVEDFFSWAVVIDHGKVFSF